MPNRAAEFLTRNTGAGVLDRARYGLTVVQPNGEQRMIRGRHPMHTPGGAEIDTDLAAGSGSWLAQGKTLDFGLVIGTAGRFQITPRPAFAQEYLDVARPQWQNPTWVNIPYTGAQRVGDAYTATGNGIAGAIKCSAAGVTLAITCDSAATLKPTRFPITVRKLAYTDGVFHGQDSTPVLRLAVWPADWSCHEQQSPIPFDPVTWPDQPCPVVQPRVDTAGEHGTVTWGWDGSYLTLTPNTPVGFTYPAVMRVGVTVYG